MKSNNLLNIGSFILFYELNKAEAFFPIPSFYFVSQSDISIDFDARIFGVFFLNYQFSLQLRTKTLKSKLSKNPDIQYFQEVSKMIDKHFSFHIDPIKIQELFSKNDMLLDLYKNNQNLNYYFLYLIKDSYLSKKTTF